MNSNSKRLLDHDNLTKHERSKVSEEDSVLQPDWMQGFLFQEFQSPFFLHFDFFFRCT